MQPCNTLRSALLWVTAQRVMENHYMLRNNQKTALSATYRRKPETTFFLIRCSAELVRAEEMQ